MPQLAKLAERAIVYHNHHATADFTSPGTASLLTGTLPWTHRAVNYGGTIAPSKVQHNIFRAFEHHHSVAYSHNVLVNELLRQLISEMDQYVPRYEMLLNYDWIERFLVQDIDTSSVARYFILDQENPLTNSLFLSEILRNINRRTDQALRAKYESLFPLGLPEGSNTSSLTLEDSHQWLIENLAQIPAPFLGYFHFLPPHAPYNTRADFVDRFADGWNAVEKPDHFFESDIAKRAIPLWRREYDEFIAYVDDEFAKLYRTLADSGLLDNTLLVLTSDHGEMFERGLVLHGKKVFYEPIMKVPLLIFDPDHKERIDIFEPTSAIDLLPSLLQLTGQQIPEWAEGEILPPYRKGAGNETRSIFAATAIDSQALKPFSVGTYAIVRANHKLIHYEGYPELPDKKAFSELYDLRNDPEELQNLAKDLPDLAEELLKELLNTKRRGDEPFA